MKKLSIEERNNKSHYQATNYTNQVTSTSLPPPYIEVTLKRKKHYDLKVFPLFFHYSITFSSKNSNINPLSITIFQKSCYKVNANIDNNIIK